MAKKIPDDLFQEYMGAKMKLDVQNLKVQHLAAKLRKMQAQGFEHPQLRFNDNISWRPDWKKLVKELVQKFMKPGPRAIFWKNLRKRFKPTKGAMKICILAPRYEKHQEAILELKKKYGIKKVSEEA